MDEKIREAVGGVLGVAEQIEKTNADFEERTSESKGDELLGNVVSDLEEIGKQAKGISEKAKRIEGEIK